VTQAPTARTLLPLSLLWLFLLGGLGAFLPFFSLYLHAEAGLSGTRIGTVLAVTPLVGLSTQLLWGQLADRTGARAGVLAIVAVGSAAGYALLGLAEGFVWILSATAFLSLFQRALVPGCVGLSLALLGPGGQRAFGYTRVWGTVGFGVTVVCVPWIVGEAGAGEATPSHFARIFAVAAALSLTAAVLVTTLPRTRGSTLRAGRGEWRALLSHRPFLAVTGACFLIFFTSQGPMVLFPILVREQGGDLRAISLMWLLMLALEVPLVAGFGSIHGRVGPRAVIVIGAGAGAVRWLVSGFASELSWVATAQLLHGVSVWGVVLGAPVYVDAVVPERLRSTAQAALATVGVGVASVLSNLAGGWLMEHYDPMAPARVGGVLSVAVTAVVAVLLPRPARPSD